MICFRYSRPTNLSSINIVERKIKFCSFLISLPGSFASVSPGARSLLWLWFIYPYPYLRNGVSYRAVHYLIFFPALVHRKISFPSTV